MGEEALEKHVLQTGPKVIHC